MIKGFINFLTLLRIFLAIFIATLIIFEDLYILALILFCLAGISDYFDGYLARKYNATSEIGEILDPIADKILIIFILFTLSVNLSSHIIGFLSAIIISREIWVSALRDFSSRKDISATTKVTYIAKLKTSAQLFTILIYLLGLASNIMIFILLGDILLILSTFITIYTGYEYTLNVYKNI